MLPSRAQMAASLSEAASRAGYLSAAAIYKFVSKNAYAWQVLDDHSDDCTAARAYRYLDCQSANLAADFPFYGDIDLHPTLCASRTWRAQY